MEVPEHIIQILSSKDALHDRVYHYIGKGLTQFNAYRRTIEEVNEFAPEYEPYSSADSYIISRHQKFRRKKVKNKVNRCKD